MTHIDCFLGLEMGTLSVALKLAIQADVGIGVPGGYEQGWVRGASGPYPGGAWFQPPGVKPAAPSCKFKQSKALSGPTSAP